MKKIFSVVVAISISFSSVYAACCWNQCTAEALEDLANAQKELAKDYAIVFAKVELLRLTYRQYEKALIEQRELLEQLQVLSKKNTLLEREILFLRGNDNEVIGLTIDSVAAEKEIDR